jgi:GLPGLI family protein
MKFYMTLAAGIFLQHHLWAQQQGTITYLETAKMKVELDSATLAMVGNSFPSENRQKKLLLFNENESLYLNAPEEEKKQEMEEMDGKRIEIRMNTPEEKIYSDLKNHHRTEQRDFMEKLFLIDTAMAKTNWKLTGRQKTILNYPCQQAVKIDQQDTVTAWFTSALPVSTGPMGLNGLPGMILETENHHGDLHVVAQVVDLQQPNTALLVKPKEGKKITPHAFRKIVEERTKEMQEEYGGKGNVIIKVERH